MWYLTEAAGSNGKIGLWGLRPNPDPGNFASEVDNFRRCKAQLQREEAMGCLSHMTSGASQ